MLKAFIKYISIHSCPALAECTFTSMDDSMSSMSHFFCFCVIQVIQVLWVVSCYLSLKFIQRNLAQKTLAVNPFFSHRHFAMQGVLIFAPNTSMLF